MGRDRVVQAERTVGRSLLQCHRGITRSELAQGPCGWRRGGREERGCAGRMHTMVTPWLDVGPRGRVGAPGWAGVIHTRDTGEIM